MTITVCNVLLTCGKIIVTIMQEFEDVYDALWEEIEVNLEASLKSMEQALKKQSLLTRLNEQFPHHSNS